MLYRLIQEQASGTFAFLFSRNKTPVGWNDAGLDIPFGRFPIFVFRPDGQLDEKLSQLYIGESSDPNDDGYIF